MFAENSPISRWIYHKDLRELYWRDRDTEIDKRPLPIRDWPDAAYSWFRKPQGIDYDLKKLMEGKPTVLRFKDHCEAGMSQAKSPILPKFIDWCYGTVIYLTPEDNKMHFQTSMNTDGITPGMRHVEIRFQFGIAVAANYPMAHQPKEDYHGALGLAPGA